MKRREKYMKIGRAEREPDGWPLVRPATASEWEHVLKAMIVRRVPKTRRIHKYKLIEAVESDIRAASDAGRIYVDAERAFVNVDGVLMKLVRDRVLGTAFEDIVDPTYIYPARPIFRTDYTGEWERLIPVTVRAIVGFMPTVDLLDLLVDALSDDER